MCEECYPFVSTQISFSTVEPIVYPTRWALLKDVISPNFAIALAAYGFVGGILMNSYFSTSVPFLGSLSTRCTHRYFYYMNDEAFKDGSRFILKITGMDGA